MTWPAPNPDDGRMWPYRPESTWWRATTSDDPIHLRRIAIRHGWKFRWRNLEELTR